MPYAEIRKNDDRSARLCPVSIQKDANAVYKAKPAPHQKEWLKLSEEEQGIAAGQALIRLSGAVNTNVSKELLLRTACAMPHHDSLEKKLELVVQFFSEMQPQDAFEGMLCSQALIAHAQGLEAMRLAANGSANSSPFTDRYVNYGSKLMKLFQETLASLEKYRRKGKQNLVVEHVHVNQGGQAIIGNVTSKEG